MGGHARHGSHADTDRRQVEVPVSIPFAEDEEHAPYDAADLAGWDRARLEAE